MMMFSWDIKKYRGDIRGIYWDITNDHGDSTGCRLGWGFTNMGPWSPAMWHQAQFKPLVYQRMRP